MDRTFVQAFQVLQNCIRAKTSELSEPLQDSNCGSDHTNQDEQEKIRQELYFFVNVLTEWGHNLERTGRFSPGKYKKFISQSKRWIVPEVQEKF